MSKRNALGVMFALILLVCATGPVRNTAFAANSRYFPETGKTVNDPFLAYWTGHGALAQQGYPITDAYNERNDADGKVYMTQYFERARFEYHPENADPKFKVLLGLLGKEALDAKYGDTPPDDPTKTVPGGGAKTFQETGKTVTGLFLNYWNSHGGLEQQGYPITEAYEEVNDADGQTYITQYFERARFEYHPENADPKFKVLLGLVGSEIYGLKQGGGGTNGTGGTGGGPTPTTVNPGPIVTAQNTLSIPGWTHIAVTTNNVALFYDAQTGHAATARLNPDGSLTVLQKFPDANGNAGLNAGIFIITPGPNNRLLLYKPDGTASVCAMGDNGIIGECRGFTFEKYWTDISIDRQTGLMRIYSSTAGALVVGKVNPDGTLVQFSSGTNYVKQTRRAYPIGNGMWLLYDFNTKDGVTFTINKDTGSITRLQTVPDLGATWSAIASNQSTIGFYSTSSQSSLIASTALDGSIVKLKSYYAPPNITIVTAALNGPYLNYWGSTGELTVVKVASDGSATNLQQYAPKK